MNYFNRAAKGVSWMAVLRVTIRSMTILKIAILARLLSPAQFGVYGIALLVLGFLETLTETGINVFLIQEEEGIDKYLNSAWVVSILRGAAIGILILVTSPLITSFFNAPSVMPLLYLAALVAFIRGFINPYEVTFQKNLEFNKEFIFRSSLFLIDTSAALILAYMTRSESVLIWGMVLSALAETVVSFLIFSKKPKFTLEFEKVKHVINRGKWITGAGTLGYAFQNLDNIIVGRILGVAPLGLYQQAYKVSTLPVAEVAEVFNKVTFPVYVSIRDEKARLREAFFKTSVVVSALVIPFGILLFTFAREIVLVFLGENWLGAVEALKVLAVFGIVRATLSSAYSLFLAVKKQQIVTLVELVSIVALAVLVVPFTQKWGIVGTAWSVVIGGAVSFPVIAYFLFRELK